VVEVAKAVPVKRSVKAIPNNIVWFLFIVIELEVDALYYKADFTLIIVAIFGL